MPSGRVSGTPPLGGAQRDTRRAVGLGRLASPDTVTWRSASAGQSFTVEREQGSTRAAQPQREARFGEPLEQREERRHAVSERTSSEARTDRQTQARPLGAGRAEQGSDGLRPRRVTPGGSRPAPRPPSGGKGTRNATDPPTEEPPLGAAPTAVDRYRLRQRRNRPSGWRRQRWTGFFHKGGGWLRPAATRGPRFGVAPIRSRSRSPDGRAASSPLSGGGGSAGRPNVRRTEPRSGRAQCPRALRNAARGAVPRRSVPGDDQRPASKRARWGNPARAPSSGAGVDARDNGLGSTWTER